MCVVANWYTANPWFAIAEGTVYQGKLQLKIRMQMVCRRVHPVYCVSVNNI